MADHRQAGSLWTPEEDVILLRHVAKYGTKHWGYLQTSGILPHRDQKACCNRFILLKRKFFQARAKGQRLTFPVVPQAEPPVVKRTAPSPSTSSGRNSPSHLLHATPSVGLKRSGSPVVNSPSKVLKLDNISRTQSSLSELDTISGGYSPEQSAILVRTMESLPEKPSVLRQESVVSSVQQAPPPLSFPSPTLPKTEAMDNMLMHSSATRQQKSTSAAAQNCSPGFADVSSILQSSAWKCFNPDDLSTLLSEVTDQTYLTVPNITQTSGAMNSNVIGPDALLEQMAAAPMKTLFGENSTLTSAAENLLEAHACGEGASWTQAPTAGFDLWDIMRASAAV